MIFIELEGLPPTSNHAYIDTPHGRVLTKAGKKYKADVVAHIVKYHAVQTKELAKEATIGCFVAYGMPNLLTAGWPKKAKHRYTKQDLTNFPKLLQDAIVEASAIDDSQICFDYKYKYQSQKAETKVWIWNEDHEPTGARLVHHFGFLISQLGKV
jgi:Holliday junction resolvase RusA-like endonuclease